MLVSIKLSRFVNTARFLKKSLNKGIRMDILSMVMELELLCMLQESSSKRSLATLPQLKKSTKSILLIEFRYHLAEKKIKLWDPTTKTVIKPT